MKNKAKRFLALLCSIVVAAPLLLLTACNGSETESSVVESSETSETSQESTPDESNESSGDSDMNGTTDAVTRTDLKIIADVNNTGQPNYYISAYAYPQTFVERGVNAKVFDLADSAQYALLWPKYTVQGTENSIFTQNEREWIENKRDDLIKRYQEFKEAGIKVYFTMDMIVLPKSMLKTGLDYRTNGKIDIRKEATRQMITDMFDEMFEVFVDEEGNSLIDGIFVRTGETYTGETHGLPYHQGNNPLDVYKADMATESEATIACHTDFVNILREELCVKHDKDLIYRTWSFGDFHNNKGTYLSVSDQIEPHENLYFSIKYLAGDFFRNVSFNQCLNAGKHQQV
ncbi:MAG TPA: hypothetical protein H9671_07570, partial [Firmicutes bacterium]|nr:hypothetical protein [Bacillota bacterium]